jgi:hypothetical protein
MVLGVGFNECYPAGRWRLSVRLTASARLLPTTFGSGAYHFPVWLASLVGAGVLVILTSGVIGLSACTVTYLTAGHD